MPLRVVQIVNSGSDPDVISYATLQSGVQAANEVFKSAGVQYWIKSYERWVSPQFSDLSTASNPSKTWTQVRSDLQVVFPGMPSNAWTDGTQKVERFWLRAAATRYADWSETILWVPVNGGTYHQGFAPEWGTAAVIYSGGNIPRYKFAHELGHTLGAHHPSDITWAGDEPLFDPKTYTVMKPEHLWDLVYKPGTPNLFFSSEAEAQPHSASLQPIHTGSNCVTQPDGYMDCTVNGVHYYTGSNALKGIAFTFASGFGPNVTSYDDLNSEAHSFSISDSQIGRIRKYLRYELATPEPWKTNIMFGANGSDVAAGRRPRLGEGHNREASFKLDFDGDGRRDIGVWVPPTDAASYGSFIVLLSTYGFSVSAGQHINVAFGRLGDIPVPADYNGDGRADVAVYQPGGGLARNDPTSTTGYWRWCPTQAGSPPSTSCGHDGFTPIGFGERQSVPLPGLDFDGNPSTAELAFYTPAYGLWWWRPVSGGSGTARFLGSPGEVPLPGHYDGDWKTDIAVYNPATALFQMARSELSWSPPLVTSQFSNVYVGSPNTVPGSGSSAQRGAGIPLNGVFRAKQVCQGGNCWNEPRRVFSLWFPPNGTWVTKWDIFAGGSPTSCQWGVDIDMPIVHIDRDGDMSTEMAIYRADKHSGSNSNAWLSIRNSNGGASCNGTQTNYALWSLNRPRNMVFAVSDMTGDGKAEILIVDPDTMTINWLTSQSDYTIWESRTIGNQRAVVL
ncbi:MAG: hypothetical protein AMXMBFR58_38610 [Phycisphaerae bacterium]